MAKEKLKTGMRRNVAGALSYVLFWVTGILILLLEEDREVRFHAWQSIIFFSAVTVFAWLLPYLFDAPLLFLVGFIFNFSIFIIWLLLIIMTYRGKKPLIPIVSGQAEKLSKK